MLNLVSYFLLVNAVTLRREFSTILNWLAILTLLYSVTILRIGTGIGMNGGLFQTISITHIFNLFISIIGAIVLLVTMQEGRKADAVGYPFIILLTLIGPTFLISISDLVSMFLAIELQSYGLYFGFCADTEFLALLLVPAVTYSNAGLLEKLIKKENQGKSGVYRWTNLVNGNTYIGSSVDLGRRLKLYYNPSHLTNLNMVIYRAIKKHKHSNFRLEILEYCEPSDVISREQYFLDLLKPEYNILPTAGSSLGYKHSKESLAKMSEAQKGENHPFFGKAHSEETKTLISEALKGKNNPMFGKTFSHSEETKAKLSLSRSDNIKVEVTDLDTNISTTYNSINAVAKALNISSSRIFTYFARNQQKPFKGRYVFSKKK